MIEFTIKEELLNQAEKDRACQKGLDWANEQESFESILKEIPLEYRIWCLIKGYSQFIDDCPWEQLNRWDWVYLLSYQPQFSDRCPWEKLDGLDWSNLLSKQPQFIDDCPWEKLDGWDWSILLSRQPQFSEFCLCWEKIDETYWTYLLSKQPQLEIFRK